MFILGSIKFEGLKGFTELSSSVQANYAQHALIEGKPRLQRVGTNLEVISGTVKLHVAFCNPEQELAKFYDAFEGAEILPLTNAAGTYFGRYVLDTVELTYNKTDGKGALVECEVRIKLLESLNPDETPASRANAFAMANRAPGQILRPVATPATDALKAAEQMTVIVGASSAVDSEVLASVADTTIADTTLPASSKRLANVQVSLQKLNQVISNTQSNIYDAANDLRSHLSTVQGFTTTLENACSLVDTAAAEAANLDYQQSIKDMKVFFSKIAAIAATRI